MDADSETHEPDELEDLQPAAPPTSSPVPEGPEEPAEDAPPAEKRKRKPRPLESPAREPGKSLFPVSRVQKVLKADKVRLRLIPLLLWGKAETKVWDVGAAHGVARGRSADKLRDGGVREAHQRGEPPSCDARREVDGAEEGYRCAQSYACMISPLTVNCAIASVCRRADEFLFLEGACPLLSGYLPAGLSPRLPHQCVLCLPCTELIPLYEPETAGRRKPKALQAKDTADGPRTTTMLDKFVSRPKDAQESGEAGGIESGEDGGAATEDVQMHEDGTMTG